jgi:hypothetical protein
MSEVSNILRGGVNEPTGNQGYKHDEKPKIPAK